MLGIVGSIIRFGSFLGGNIVMPVSPLILENCLDGLLTILWSICCFVCGRLGQCLCGDDKLFVIDDGDVTLRVEV